MLTMLHNNPARIEAGHLIVDRKFHSGMQEYVRSLKTRIVSVHPQADEGALGMDLIRVPLSSMGYEVLVIGPEGHSALEDQIRQSTLVTGYGPGIRLAKKLGVPYIMVVEYDLRTQLVVATSGLKNWLRITIRSLRNILRYLLNDVPDMRGALALHCNGYPVFDESRRYNEARLLYLDSRMSADSIISEADLETRLSTRHSRPVKLLFSGRYEPMKGAADAVRVAVECLRQGLPIEAHFYGQGSLKSTMEAIARTAPQPGRIWIHDAIPFPELVERSRDFDVFVCCHIQSDPSCTYLESFGSGLPVVGYDNAMWRRLSSDSGVGHASRIGDVQAVVDSIRMLIEDPEQLAGMSRSARRFALAHTAEKEFDLRTQALRSALDAICMRSAPAAA